MDLLSACAVLHTHRCFSSISSCHIIYRSFNASAVTLGKVPNNLKGKKSGSQSWLRRQMKDPYVQKSHAEDFRCRSAFKLLEIDDKYKLFRPGMVVVDCGAAPGSWSQVAVARVNSCAHSADPVGQVIGVDLQHIDPIKGATFLNQSDFTLPATQQRIAEQLDGKKADIVLSDMSPRSTGVKSLDHDLSIKLCLSALKFSAQILTFGGTFLCKVLQGNQQNQLDTLAGRVFSETRIVKPASSRKDSSEVFLLCQRFQGLHKQ